MTKWRTDGSCFWCCALAKTDQEAAELKAALNGLAGKVSGKDWETVSLFARWYIDAQRRDFATKHAVSGCPGIRCNEPGESCVFRQPHTPAP